MFVSSEEKAARCRGEQRRLTLASTTSNAHFARVAHALTLVKNDGRFLALLKSHGIRPFLLGRSSCTGRSGSGDAVGVMEAVVLAGCVTVLLEHADIVRWLARHHPAALAAFQLAADCGLGKESAQSPDKPG